jgi:hypothetical protein
MHSLRDILQNADQRRVALGHFLRLARRHGVEEGLNAHPNEIAPYKILPAAVNAVGAIVARRLRLFNKLPQAPASAA